MKIRHPLPRASFPAALAALALALAACTAGGAAWTYAPTAPASPSASAGPTGTPGPTATPNPDSRTVKIEATVAIRFVPDSVEVKKGETIRFEITNTAAFPHNFFVGPQAEVEKKNAAALAGTIDYSEGTQVVEYTFDGEGPYAFGCFIPGHYEGGMKGTITLTP